MISEPREVFVWTWLPGEVDPVVAGRVVAEGTRYDFAYGRSYLARENAIPLYLPELPLQAGVQTPPGPLDMANCLRDGLPDRWGRRVIINRLTGRKGADAADVEFSDLVYMLESGSDRIGALDFQASATEYVARGGGRTTPDDLADIARDGGTAIFGDKGYVSDKRKRAARARGATWPVQSPDILLFRAARARGATWAVKGKRKPGRVLSASQKKRNKKYGIVRAKVPSRACQNIRCRAAEHVFRVIKCQFGYRKVRYHGLAKNEAQMFSLPLGHVNMPCRAVDGAGQTAGTLVMMTRGAAG